MTSTLLNLFLLPPLYAAFGAPRKPSGGDGEKTGNGELPAPADSSTQRLHEVPAHT